MPGRTDVLQTWGIISFFAQGPCAGASSPSASRVSGDRILRRLIRIEEVVNTAVHHKAGPGTPDALSREREVFRLEGDSCGPALLFLPSLDYRDKTGRRDLPLLLPWNVRLATVNLNTSILAAFEGIEAETDAGGSLPSPAEGSVREQGSGDARKAVASTR